MKNYIFILALLFAFNNSLHAQNRWRAVYQFKVIQSEASKKRQDSLIKMNPQLASIYKQLQEKFSNITYYLDFTKNESVFKEQEKLDESRSSMGVKIISISGNNESILYKNLKDKEYVKTTQMFDGKYRIVDKLPDYKWKITKETRQIGNYLVIKAIGSKTTKNKEGKEKTTELIAWFTPQIPVGNGPDLYGGLPGLIMELRTGNKIYLAKEIIVNPKKTNKIIKPDKGEAISKEAFNKKSEAYIQKMKKMHKNNRNGKSNTFIIGG